MACARSERPENKPRLSHRGSNDVPDVFFDPIFIWTLSIQHDSSMDLLQILSSLQPPARPDLTPLPSTVPLTPQAAFIPPLLYYLAAILLPQFPSNRYNFLISLLRNILAATSAFLFFRLPLRYHVPFSIGLTYQLALVGLYGGCRVLDAFFISLYFFDFVPRRVKYHHAPRELLQTPCGPDAESYFSLHFLREGGNAVTETATTDEGWPHGWKDRMSWALELELSMRGAGFTCRYSLSSSLPLNAGS